MPNCLALDFGASSIRLSAVTLNDRGLHVDELARFANRPCFARGHWVWDYPQIYAWLEGVLSGLAGASTPYESIGVDSWGVDYVLLDQGGSLIGDPICYRDARTRNMADRFTASHLSAEAIYAGTGLPVMEINTLFQLYAHGQEAPEQLQRAQALLFTADYAHYWLSGQIAGERSLSSTSQMLTLEGGWWEEAVRCVGLPLAALPPVVASGSGLGPLRPALAQKLGFDMQVIAPCAHDTQSAILAVPAEGENWAYLSSGTWSILGVESTVPITGAVAHGEGIGNESGYGGSYCVQSTVTGLWLVQEIARLSGCNAATLAAAAEAAPGFRSLINPADQRFLAPEDMISEIRAACREAGEPEPEDLGALARCAYDSLALLYRAKLATLTALTGRKIDVLHVVGGGSQVALLNHLCAGSIGLPVLVGPSEASSIGNGLAQLIALGAVRDASAARALVRAAFSPAVVAPKALPGLDSAILRFETFNRT